MCSTLNKLANLIATVSIILGFQLAPASAEMPTNDEICLRSCQARSSIAKKRLDAQRDEAIKQLKESVKSDIDALIVFGQQYESLKFRFENARAQINENWVLTCAKTCLWKKEYLMYADCEYEREFYVNGLSFLVATRVKSFTEDNSLTSGERARMLEGVYNQTNPLFELVGEFYQACLKMVDDQF